MKSTHSKKAGIAKAKIKSSSSCVPNKITRFPPKEKPKIKPPLNKIKKIVKKSSSKLMRSIRQKINLVSGKNCVKFAENVKASASMFAPIMKSIRIVSRRILPKKKHSNSEKRPGIITSRINNEKRLNGVSTEMLEPTNEFDCINSVSKGKRKTASMKPPNKKFVRTNLPLKRPYLAPVEKKNTSFKDLSLPKKKFSRTNDLTCSPKLYNINSKFSNCKTSVGSEKRFCKSKKNGKPVKPFNQTEIRVEGIPKEVSFVCKQKFSEDVNPQLMDSLPSIVASYFSDFGLEGEKENEDKEVKLLNENVKREKIIASRRAYSFISKIPDKPFAKKGNFNLSNGIDENTFPLQKSRHFLGDTSVIIEENLENEVLDDCNSSSEDKTATMMWKFQDYQHVSDETKDKFDMFEQNVQKKNSRNLKDEIHNVVRRSNLTIPKYKEQNGNIKSKYLEQNKKEIKYMTDDNEKKRVDNISNQTSERLGDYLDDDIDLQELLFQYFRARNEPTTKIEAKSSGLKTGHASLRRGFLTLPMEEGKHDLSMYDSCITHMSEDEITVEKQQRMKFSESSDTGINNTSTDIAKFSGKMTTEESKNNSSQWKFSEIDYFDMFSPSLINRDKKNIQATLDLENYKIPVIERSLTDDMCEVEIDSVSQQKSYISVQKLTATISSICDANIDDITPAQTNESDMVCPESCEESEELMKQLENDLNALKTAMNHLDAITFETAIERNQLLERFGAEQSLEVTISTSIVHEKIYSSSNDTFEDSSNTRYGSSQNRFVTVRDGESIKTTDNENAVLSESLVESCSLIRSPSKSSNLSVVSSKVLEQSITAVVNLLRSINLNRKKNPEYMDKYVKGGSSVMCSGQIPEGNMETLDLEESLREKLSSLLQNKQDPSLEMLNPLNNNIKEGEHEKNVSNSSSSMLVYLKTPPEYNDFSIESRPASSDDNDIKYTRSLNLLGYRSLNRQMMF